MKISLVTPVAAGSRSGNRTTADRWSGFLRQMGHKALLEEAWCGERSDLMIALHERGSRGARRWGTRDRLPHTRQRRDAGRRLPQLLPRRG
jgi:hypothetical protein